MHGIICAYFNQDARTGFHTEGGLEFPPRNLELSMVIIDLSQVYINNNLVPDCARSNLKDLNSTFFGRGGGHAPRPPSRHACVSHTTIILLPSCFPTTPQLKILYETLKGINLAL